MPRGTRPAGRSTRSGGVVNHSVRLGRSALLVFWGPSGRVTLHSEPFGRPNRALLARLGHPDGAKLEHCERSTLAVVTNRGRAAGCLSWGQGSAVKITVSSGFAHV